MADDRWEILDHVCRICFGRLLSSAGDHGALRVRCADCEAETTGPVERLCVCGAKQRHAGQGGLRCRINPSPSPEMPERVVVTYVEDKSCHG